MNGRLGLFAVILLAFSISSSADEVNVGGGAVKVDERGVSVGGGVIEVTPGGIKVPGVTINTGAKAEWGSARRGQSTAGQIFNGSDFSDADLSGRDFSGGRFIGVDFSDANLSRANFTGAHFQGVDFSDANLTDAVFINSTFQGDDFSDADLARANFSSAHFQGADFSDANLQDACFIRAHLIGNNFSSALLSGAIFVDANRIGNDFGNADLSGVVWKGPSACPGEQVAVTRPEVTKAAAITQALAGGKNAQVDLTVNFEFDSDKIQTQGHVQVLEIADALKSPKLTHQRVMIEGHTDSVGEDGYNLDLSYRRAVSVMRALVEQYGIDRSRLEVNGFGETRPVATNDTDEGRGLNRRVTLVNIGAS